jgi:hypothetical protein
MVSGDTARTPDEGWTAGSQSTEYDVTAIRLVSTSAARFSRAVLPPRPTQHNKAAQDCRFGGLIRSCIVGICGERNGHAVVRKNSAGHRSECRHRPCHRHCACAGRRQNPGNRPPPDAARRAQAAMRQCCGDHRRRFEMAVSSTNWRAPRAMSTFSSTMPAYSNTPRSLI